MGLKSGRANITITVSQELHDELHVRAQRSGLRVSVMLAPWLEVGVTGKIECKAKSQTVRAVKDELMISLPMDFVHRCDIHKKDVAELSYSENSVLITFKKV